MDVLPLKEQSQGPTIQPRFEQTGDSILQTLRENPLLTFFIALALLVRLVFWLYTGRIWEDALITATAARNVWVGFGLTHHASEPRVHCFTSPISVLIPLLTGPYGGILALRLSSLVASIGAIFFAYRIGVLSRFHWAAQVLVLTYLACDQLQIFFGMAGMETQVVTTIALGVIYFYLQRSWSWLGFFCGLAMISRPEFILFLLPPIAIALLLFHRAAILRVLGLASLIGLPWFGFATLYYGSPIPNTIVAKSFSFRLGFSSTPWQFKWQFLKESWSDYAPFREFTFCYAAPTGDLVLKIIVFAFLLLFLFGSLVSVRRRSALFLCGAAVIGFLIYRSTIVLNHYYMWYLPPFLALAFIVAGYGLSQLAIRFPKVAISIAMIIGGIYALHLPFSMPLDRKVQRRIEDEVRAKTGTTLNAMMTEKDSAVLEPLGFIGWASFNKTIYDFPGLGSKVAVQALKEMREPSLAGLVDALQPTYVVLRSFEFDGFQEKFPTTASQYELAAEIKTPSKIKLQRWGCHYGTGDDDFRILRRGSNVAN
jgi:hypothetical protein